MTLTEHTDKVGALLPLANGKFAIGSKDKSIIICNQANLTPLK